MCFRCFATEPASLPRVSDSNPHHNQAGGDFVEIKHVAVHGRERELRNLVDVARRLNELTVTADLNAEQTTGIAARVEALADKLRPHVANEPIHRMGGAEYDDWMPHRMSPFDVITGMYNPVALPLRLRDDGECAVGEGLFNVLYAGPPGCLHGAVISACFDMVLAGANRLAGNHGPTANLTTTYLKPTKIDEPVEFRCWQDHKEGRKIFALGELRQNGKVTATCKGLFIQLDRSDIERLGAD